MPTLYYIFDRIEVDETGKIPIDVLLYEREPEGMRLAGTADTDEELKKFIRDQYWAKHLSYYLRNLEGIDLLLREDFLEVLTKPEDRRSHKFVRAQDIGKLPKREERTYRTNRDRPLK